MRGGRKGLKNGGSELQIRCTRRQRQHSKVQLYRLFVASSMLLLAHQLCVYGRGGEGKGVNDLRSASSNYPLKDMLSMMALMILRVSQFPLNLYS